MSTPKEADYYDALYETTEEYRRNYKHSRYFVLWSQLLKFIRGLSAAAPAPEILEIGCGNGRFAAYLFDEGYTAYHGFDFSPKAVEFARRTSPQSFSIGDALAEEPYRREYDTAVASEVLEHLDDFAVLDRLREGTAVVFSLPTFDDPAHLRRFTSPRRIVARYYDRVDIQEIVRVDQWFACWGYVRRFRPKLWNRLFKVRKTRELKYVFGGLTPLLKWTAEKTGLYRGGVNSPRVRRQEAGKSCPPEVKTGRGDRVP